MCASQERRLLHTAQENSNLDRCKDNEVNRVTEALPDRNEVLRKHTWDSSSIFDADEVWEAAIEEVHKDLKTARGYQGRLAEGAEVLSDYMEHAAALMERVGHIYVYANMCHTVDTTDSAAAARNDRARALFGQVMAALAFDDPELLEIGFETLKEWLAKEPRLTIYEHYLDNLKRRQAHVRSPEIEELMGMVIDPFRTATAVHGTLADADLSFVQPEASEVRSTTLPLTRGTIDALISDPDRELRRTAWQNYADAFLAFRNTMAGLLSAGVKQNVFTSRVRCYPSALEAALDGDNIPTEVFYNTIEAFRKHLPIWHRYWRIRRIALGYDQLYRYDVKTPLTKYNEPVPYSQAVAWNLEGMAPLGTDYVDIMRRGLTQERWVDVYPNKGKRSGAFSTGFKGTHPFILMNYNDDLMSMSILAHELGHSMHSYFSRKTQPLVYASYSLFVAEVASNFNQALVRAYLLDLEENADFQIALIEEAMANFYRYFFLMPTLARFELEIHQRVERGQGLNADSLTELTADLFQEGFGDEVEIDRDRLGITWAQFSNHLYANFYVYQYATGIAGAHSLARDVLSGNAGAVERYLAFLKSGGSMYPLDALELAGINMASPEPVERTFRELASLVDRLEVLTASRY
jgi:oligoendopeptidase F